LNRTFFTDRDLGRQFPNVLASAGLTVERHDDLFGPTTTDEEWLAHCGRNGLVAVTHNERIRYTPNERDAVIEHGVTLLVVVGRAPFVHLARSFVATMPRIERFLRKESPPLIAKVYRAIPSELARNPSAPGNVKRWYPPSR
jgi:hypothetical protein